MKRKASYNTVQTCSWGADSDSLLYEVSDYRDTIYAVPSANGAISKISLFYQALNNIQPDYSNDVFKVFKDFTNITLSASQCIPGILSVDPGCLVDTAYVPAEWAIESQYCGATHPSEVFRMEEVRWVYTWGFASWMLATERLAFDYDNRQKERAWTHGRTSESTNLSYHQILRNRHRLGNIAAAAPSKSHLRKHQGQSQMEHRQQRESNSASPNRLARVTKVRYYPYVSLCVC